MPNMYDERYRLLSFTKTFVLVVAECLFWVGYCPLKIALQMLLDCITRWALVSHERSFKTIFYDELICPA